jgi:hypothetical protein
METEKEINKKILTITVLIQEKYPELLKYLIEMPVTIPNQNHPIINVKVLKNYLNSLNAILNDYLLKNVALKPTNI